MTAKLSRLVLQADAASELMSENPISIREDAGVREALAAMTDRGNSVAPVIDESGRPVGVVSVTDILIHDRECVGCLKPAALPVVAEREMVKELSEELNAVSTDGTTVGEIMTPAVFSVARLASARHVVQTMIAYRVHHLFVADDEGILIGVISMGDILRKLG